MASNVCSPEMKGSEKAMVMNDKKLRTDGDLKLDEGETKNETSSLANKKANWHFGQECEDQPYAEKCKLCCRITSFRCILEVVNSITIFHLPVSLAWMIYGIVCMIVQSTTEVFLASGVITIILSTLMALTLRPEVSQVTFVAAIICTYLSCFAVEFQLAYIAMFAFGVRGNPVFEGEEFWMAGFALLGLSSVLAIFVAYFLFGKYMLIIWGFISTITLISYTMCREQDSCHLLQYLATIVSNLTGFVLVDEDMWVAAVVVPVVVLSLLVITCCPGFTINMNMAKATIFVFICFVFCNFGVTYFLFKCYGIVRVYCGAGCSVMQTWGPIGVSLLIGVALCYLKTCTKNGCSLCYIFLTPCLIPQSVKN